MKINWSKLGQAFLTAIASGAGKWVIGIIVASFAVVLVVLPVVQPLKRAVPRTSETASTPTSAPTEQPSATARQSARRPTMGPPLAESEPPVMAPPMAAPPTMSDSVVACVGLRSWQARHNSDSLTPALQTALERLERQCGIVSDSVENIPR